MSGPTESVLREHRKFIIEQATQTIVDLLRKGGHIDTMAKTVVQRVADEMVREAADRVIAGGWERERRRLFLAGAEWARGQFPTAEPPDGFYHAMEAAADVVARHP